MSGFSNSQSLNVHKQRIKSIIDAQTLLRQKPHKKWCIKMYWGQLPRLGEVMHLGFSGYAITDDVEQAQEPDLSGNDGTQIIVGPHAVIIWTAPSESALGDKIKATFKSFEWEK